MSDSNIFLDYQGPVDLAVIQVLLKKLKKSREYNSLNKTTGKRLYSLVVESLENISKHSVLNTLNDTGKQPRILVEKVDGKIIITAGNPVPNIVQDNLTMRMDQINNLDQAELLTLYEKRLNQELRMSEKGAGLGLIHMAIKSGNAINYSFCPLINGYLYFELKMSLNNYIMRKLIIDQTPSTPKVILDPDNRVLQISGESRPPDVREFYDPILSWLDDYGSYLIDSDTRKEPVTFHFDFDYFNSSSGKYILDICKVVAKLHTRRINVAVNWHFEKDDMDMLEVGKEMSKIVKVPFEYIQGK
jgi:hypothetical protein